MPPRCPTSAISRSAASSRRGFSKQLGIERLRDDLDALTATNPAEAERLAAALEALRENVREVVNQALVLYGREETENLRNEILRNAPLARLERRQVEQMKALIRAIARRLRERYSQTAQAAAARPSRYAKDAAAQRRLGRRAVPHLLETPPPRPAQNRGDLRRLGIGGAGLGLLPAADPQPARGGGRRALVRLFRPSDRGLRHPRHQVAGRGDERDHVEGRFRLVRLWRLVPGFREGLSCAA